MNSPERQPDQADLSRWRLILGDPANELGELDRDAAARDAAMDWLYGRDRDDEPGARGVRRRGRGGAGDGDAGPGVGGTGNERSGGRGGSTMTTFDWIDEIHRLFPKETVERLERDAVETYEITDIVTNLDVLARVEPNQSMLRAVLRTKHLMNPEVLDMARRLVEQVVAELVERLATEVRRSFSGARNRTPSRFGSSRDFDVKRTVRANLAHYQPDERRLIIEKPLFRSRSKRQIVPWQVILLVDQSGSMVDSVIHSAITASILWHLPGIRAHLVAFDTTVVDLTSDVDDPVELLMKVNLGGGTDIAKALTYGAELIDNPRRTIVVLISDLYEGGSSTPMRRTIRSMIEQGSIVLALAALDDAADAAFDRDLGQRLADLGAHVGAMTPGGLADFIADAMGA